MSVWRTNHKLRQAKPCDEAENLPGVTTVNIVPLAFIGSGGVSRHDGDLSARFPGRVTRLVTSDQIEMRSNEDCQCD